MADIEASAHLTIPVDFETLIESYVPDDICDMIRLADGTLQVSDADIDLYALSRGLMRATDFLSDCGIVAKHTGELQDTLLVHRIHRTDADRVRLVHKLLHDDRLLLEIAADNRTQEQCDRDAAALAEIWYDDFTF